MKEPKQVDINFFEKLKGDEFSCPDHPEDRPKKLLLDAVTALKEVEPGKNGISDKVRAKPFRLTFRCERDVQPFQGCLTLKHPKVGELEPIFMVASYVTNEHLFLDAIFT